MEKNIQKPHFTDVFITPHAYQRFFERVDSSMSKDEAKDIMAEIALRGKVIHVKRGRYAQKQYVLLYRGLEILVAVEQGVAKVVTCYGDTAFAKWYRRQQHFAQRTYCA
jgi:hypothetical protein